MGYMQKEGVLGEEQREKLGVILRENKMQLFEYVIEDDCLTIYDEKINISEVIDGYLGNKKATMNIYEEDRWKINSLQRGFVQGVEEIRTIETDGSMRRKQITVCKWEKDKTQKTVLIGSIRDITKEKMEVKHLEELVQRDAMTGLYNYAFGKQKINKYLAQKQSFESCGMLMIDIDNFKSVNDNYGHLIGDHVLIKAAELFKGLFRKTDIIMRAGGDEFVIFLKEGTLPEVKQRAKNLLDAIQDLKFDGIDYVMKCSIGICFLHKSKGECSYDRMFENADKALYQAKKMGKNQYQCIVI